MYILGAESSVVAYLTTDELDPPRLFCSDSWATVVRRSTVVSITPPMFSSRRNRECIVHKIQHNPQALCYVEMKISFEH